MQTPHGPWIQFAPTGLSEAANARLVEIAVRLYRLRNVAPAQRSLSTARIRQRELADLPRDLRSDVRLIAALHVLFDLAKQGWLIEIQAGIAYVARRVNPLDPEEDRTRIREQLQVEREDHLRNEPVRSFIRAMEAKRQYNGKLVSVLSLLRDGRDLANRLRTEPAKAIEPFLQFIDGDAKCSETGLRLIDVWRYFRYTWSSPPKSVPGRTMLILVRERAAPFQPIIGIAALSSATVGLAARDEFIGWTYKQVAERLISEHSSRHLSWMRQTVDEAIDELYKEDLIAECVIDPSTLRKPSDTLIEHLISEAKVHRKQHFHGREGQDYKGTAADLAEGDEYWITQAKTPLFRSKREQELAHLLQIRMAIDNHFENGSAEQIQAFLAKSVGRNALSKLIRRAKAERVGTMIADLTICGAVPPYGEVLGGKLVAALMTSPEVAAEYRKRYKASSSVIASSMAGRAIVRPSELVFMSTTSLYGKRPSQYDRIGIPAAWISEGRKGTLRYVFLERTKGMGTFQFGQDTTEAMGVLERTIAGGPRVNYIFGEGVNPKLRRVRNAFDALGLPAHILLDHQAPRLMYAASLIENLVEFLLGLDDKPKYIVPLRGAKDATSRIGKWWMERWCLPRIERSDVLDRVELHTLVHPIRHGAKVQLPLTLAEDPVLFDDE